MQAWDKFLALQEKELGSETVQKWLRPLQVVHFDAGNIYLKATDSFQLLWFEEHIRKKAENILLNISGRKVKIHIAIDHDLNKERKSSSKRSRNKVPEAVVTIPEFSISFDTLDPHCTFEHFVGSSTHPLAHKLLFQITGSNKEGKLELGSFNPIYIWGSSGTGKTHLLMAAAHSLSNRKLKVAYVRAETFTEHVITAIRAGEMSLFRQSYRNTDVLLIDDVHLFAKKWATQEELFHTFNALHLAGKQILLSANCSPSELPFIEPRLISRFEWGIVLPLEPLQKEEIRKALQIKAKALNFVLNQKVSDFLMDTFSSSLKSLCRSLEALVLRAHLNETHSHLTPTQLTVPYVQHQLADLIMTERQGALNSNKIIQHVSEYFGIRLEDILGKAQSRDCVMPRQLAMHMCRSLLKMPFTKIGEMFSKDHSTVMSSVKVILKGIESHDQDIVEPLNAILKKLKA